MTSDNGGTTDKERIRIAGLELTLTNLEKCLKKWECQERRRKRSVKSYVVYFRGKKVRMNIVQGGPASLGGETDNCFRERVYLKDGKAEVVLKKSFISPFSSKTIYFSTLNGKKLTNICGTVQNELLFLVLV